MRPKTRSIRRKNTTGFSFVGPANIIPHTAVGTSDKSKEPGRPCRGSPGSM